MIFLKKENKRFIDRRKILNFVYNDIMNKRQQIILWVTISLTALAVAGTTYWYWARNFISGDPQKNNRRIKVQKV